jgi:tRNA uridine 5-carboxymethylaminomethyl modification enzyme
MSALTRQPTLPQLPCAVTRTTPATHDIVRANIGLAPMYAGRIDGVGPRYCPSLEDKVMRFADRAGHQIFLEPEGIDETTIYPNGISTSLPEAVQRALLATIPGLERARIERAGYAIEYDHVDPRVLTPGLRVADLNGLWLAGQINGTTGYEEAAAQGLVAGINAARAAGGGEELRFDRTTSYIGVLVDDLVTQGVSEPYRMFTSRAEYRLRLRIDNADQRLRGLGRAAGVVGPRRRAADHERAARLSTARAQLEAARATPSQVRAAGVAVRLDGVTRNAFDWLRYEAVSWEAALIVWPALGSIDASTAATLVTDARYASYIARQDDDVARFARDEALGLAGVDFKHIAGLSTEMTVRLATARPATIGAAARVPGITPAALTALLPHARRAA